MLALSICVVSGLYAHSSFERFYEVLLVTTGAVSQLFYFSHMLVWWALSSWLVAGFAPGCCPWLLELFAFYYWRFTWPLHISFLS